MVSIQYTARLLNRNRKPHVRRRRRIASATARTMKMLPAIGMTQLKNHTPDGSRVAGGASSDVAENIVASRSGLNQGRFHLYNLVDHARAVMGIDAAVVKASEWRYCRGMITRE